MAILTLSGSSSDLNAYPSASVSFYNAPYGALSGIDGDITTFTGMQTNGTPNQFYQILFNTSSITGEAQENLFYEGIQSLEISMGRNTSGRIAFITNPEGNETDEEFPYQNPAGLDDASLYTVNINPQRGLDRAYNRSLGETKIYGLRIYFDNFFAGAGDAVSDARIYEIIINYHLPKKDLFEFNDSVLSTKAWNSSRYDGKQLQASQINLATRDDVGNDSRTPIIQKYTRNIYIGNRLIGSENGGDDQDILAIPGYSYVSTNRYLTINDDLSITDTRLDNFKEGSWTTLKGFYKSFNDDFKHKTLCQIIPFDDSIEASLKQEYKIHFNIGLLKKIVKFGPAPGLTLGQDTVLEQTSSYLISTSKPAGNDTDIIFGYWPSEGDNIPGGPQIGNPETRYNSGMVPTVFSREELLDFYTGSFYGSAYTYGRVEEDALGYIGGTSDFISNSSLANFFGDLSKYSAISNDNPDPTTLRDKENRRFFVSFTESGSDTPIIVGRQGTLSSSLEGTFTENDNLTDFSTVQVVGVDTNIQGTQGLQPADQFSTDPSNPDYTQDGYGLPKLRVKNELHQHYNSNAYPIADDFSGGAVSNHSSLGFPQSPELFQTGSIIISRCDITQPSILIDLKKSEELPNGIGSKPFIIIPHNLHPFIKDNLINLLVQAGLDTGDRKVVPSLNENNRTLK